MATIKGKVIQMKGNFMPGIRTISAVSSGGRGSSESGVGHANVVIFEGKVHPSQASNMEQATRHPHFVTQVPTEGDGSYAVTGLKPNTEYTIVYETPDTHELYLNSFDGQGNWQSVTTPASANDASTTFDISDTRLAFF